MYLIEYDGEGHYMPVRFNGMSAESAEYHFKMTKLRDEIKTKFCITNNISLIRIPYFLKDKIKHIIVKEILIEKI